MATRIYRSCDRHEADGVDTPGTQRPPFMGRTVDLCEECWGVITVKELVDLLEERGAPVVDGPARKAPRRPKAAPLAAELPGMAPTPTAATGCPLCAYTGTAVASHLRRVHEVSLGDLFGKTCPLCGDTFDTGQGVAMHGRRVHGLTHTRDLFAAGEAAGDPNGVVAARREVWATLA